MPGEIEVLQAEPPATPGVDLGALVTTFLCRFGASFDYADLAVSVRQGGIVPATAITDIAQARRSGARQAARLIMEDPQVRS